MKTSASKGLEITVCSINYVIIGCALSHMAMLLKSSPLFILFFASDIWILGEYWRRTYALTRSRAVSAVLLLVCAALHIAMAYAVWRLLGAAAPLRQ